MTNSVRKKRIIIIEDDSELRESYSLIIRGTNLYDLIGEYANAEQAIAVLTKMTPDIILMDIQLPGMSGIEATRLIKERNHLIEIVMLTVHADDDMVFESLKAGASGYISKGTNFMEMLRALDEIVRGGAPMSSKIARMVINNFHANLNSPLTKRERQILQFMSRGWTYTQIAEELAISKETSKTHIRNIYIKLRVNSKSEAIDKATKEKYLN